MKQKKQLTVLAVLLLILVVVGYFYFESDKPAVTTDAGSATQDPKILSVDNPQLHTSGVEKARNTEYKSSGRVIFSRDLPHPQPTKADLDKAKQQREEEQARLVPQVPAAPQVAKLPVKFFGFGTVPNGTARVAFFSDSDNEVIIVKEGELLMNRFRILKIGNANLDYEEVSSGLRGTAILEEQAGPPSA